MKYLFLLIFCTSIILPSCSQGLDAKKTSTYYFIRHAEKDRSDVNNSDPELTKKGMERAIKWSETLKDVKFDAVYATKFNRTMATAKPVATKNKLKIRSYDPGSLNVATFLKKTKGKTILIVGHSDSTPHLVNRIIGKNKYQGIDDSNNSNLYIITINGKKITDTLKVIN